MSLDYWLVAPLWHDIISGGVSALWPEGPHKSEREETEISILLWPRQGKLESYGDGEVERRKNKREESVLELLCWAEGQAMREWGQLARRELKQK